MRAGAGIVVAAWVVACSSGGAQPSAPAARYRHPSELAAPIAGASAAFRATWFDGTAEISSYHAVIPRYGEPRDGTLMLIYVTEPFDRRTKIKDDDVTGVDRLEVLKVNATMSFLAGVYPYSVMTSVFAPVGQWADTPRFAPLKLSLTAQEWCGQIFHAVWPGQGGFRAMLASYFASDGEGAAVVATPPDTLYEDGLLIQLRELDGAFADGRDWQGALVPTLWHLRADHVPPAAVAATIVRTAAARDGRPVNRFRVRAGAYERVIDVEAAAPHRILGWTASGGERVELVETARLTYWELNHVADQPQRAALGLSPLAEVPAGAPRP